jgi:outer membrane protein OmpA-like peptidoglycan-associated protein
MINLLYILRVFLMILISTIHIYSSNNFNSIEPNKNDIIKSSSEIINFLRSKGVSQISKPTKQSLTLVVPFDFDSDQLNVLSKNQLDELGNALNDSSVKNIRIEMAGHTDEIGNEQYNFELSKRRIAATKKYLVKYHKIENNRIIAIGYGESKPIVCNANTDAEHALNRRVEIRPYDKATDPYIPYFLSERKPMEEVESKVINFGIFHVINNVYHDLLRFDGSSSLKSNDAYRIFIHPLKQIYLYIYQVDEKGNGTWLFPNKDINYSNL